MELTGYFDYEAYGRFHMKANERLTGEGIVTRIKAPKPAVGKKQNPEVVRPGTAVFRCIWHLIRSIRKNAVLFPYDGETVGIPGGEVQNI